MAFIVAALRGVVAAHMAKDRSAVPVLFLAWTRLGRLVSRFEALVAAFRAGRLLSVRAPRVSDGLDRAGLPPACRAPRDFGWLVRLVPGAAVYGSQLQYLLADPEMSALLAATPQAGRILRPLCQMLAIRPGPELGATRRGRTVSGAGVAASGGEPDTSADRAVASFSPDGLGLGAGPDRHLWPELRRAEGFPTRVSAGADPPRPSIERD